MAYTIGSFNMFKLSFKSDEETRKNYDMIVKIIIEEGFDIIAMQEVLTENVIKHSIMPRLGSDWDYCWNSPKKRKSIQAAEGYAFIWNKRIFELSPTLNGTSEPVIFNQYKLQAGQIELLRNPYYARFSPKNLLPIEIRLINTHIRFGKDGECDFSNAIQRRNEFEILTKSILNKISNRVYGNNHVGYTILLGDYNLNIRSDNNPNPYLEEMVVISYKNQDAVAKTIQTQLSSVKNDDSNKIYANNYDHFTYNDGNFEGIGISCERIDAVSKYYNNDRDKYRLEISDHVPIKLTINLK